MRDDIAALEEHLKDNPEDWDAWGVYADWLSEQGDPRGAILANACKIHRLEQDPNMSAEEHRRLYEEQDRLSRDRNDVHFSIEDGHFEGVLCFPHRLVIDEPWQGRETLRRVFKRFAKHPARPYVSELVLRTVPEVAPPLEGIRRLIIERQTSYPERGSTIGADTLRMLSARGAMSGLRGLDIASHDVGTGGLAAMLEGGPLREMRSLNLAGTGIGREGVAMLVPSVLPSLTSLDLSDNDIDVEGVQTLLSSGLRLTQLRIGNNILGNEGLRAILEAPGASALTSLDLSDNDIDIEGISALASAEGLSALTALDLSSNALGDTGVVALARARCSKTLESLSLRGIAVGDEGVSALAGATLASLRALHLGYNRITSEGLQILARSPTFAGLRSLDIAHNRVDDRGLIDISSLEALQQIDISHNPYSVAAGRALMRFAHTRKLIVRGELPFSNEDDTAR